MDLIMKILEECIRECVKRKWPDYDEAGITRLVNNIKLMCPSLDMSKPTKHPELVIQMITMCINSFTVEEAEKYLNNFVSKN